MITEAMKFAKQSINYKCQICKGQCWDEKSQKNTQQNCLNMFGSIANDCVNNADGTPRCPAALGLLK